MNCNTFRKHINEYLNNELFLEVREAMDDHRKGCKECQELYLEELELDNLFKSALVGENITFKSSRGEIINSIDKKRYSKSPINKLKFSLAKNKIKLSSAALAACLLMFIFTSNLFQFNLSLDPSAGGVSDGGASLKATEDEAANRNPMKIEANDKIEATAIESNYQDFVEKLRVYSEPYRSADSTIKFTIKERLTEEQYTNPSSWKASPDKEFSALLDGKGEMLTKDSIVNGVREEGNSVIVVKNNATKTAVDITTESSEDNKTPLFIEWTEHGELLVIVGYSQGTVVRGGDVYLLDINTGGSVLVYKAESDLGEEAAVVETSEVGTSEECLTIYIMKYLDDNKTTGSVKEATIVLDKVDEDNLTSYDEEVIDLVSLINMGSSEKLDEVFLMDYSYDNEQLGELKGIKSSSVKSLRRINNFYDQILNIDYGIENVATYLVEIDYKLIDGYKGPLKNGITYQVVTIAQPTGDKGFKIADIFTVPNS